MIDAVTLKNFGPIRDLQWSPLGRINAIIGRNGSGKTFLLKAIYASYRTLEEFRQGDDPRKLDEVLRDKLFWTFQVNKIGDLVSKRAEGQLEFTLEFNGKTFHYNFGPDTTRLIRQIHYPDNPRPGTSIFLPAKEVISIQDVILTSRERDKIFGFDDTYLDLVRAIRKPRQRGNFYAQIRDARKNLREMLGGRIEIDDKDKTWSFKEGQQIFPIEVSAEGIRKIALLDILLGNRHLEQGSVVFIDEPEAALHPVAITTLLEVISLLSEIGIQFIIASHSYFVIKKLYLIAQRKALSIPILSCDEGAPRSQDQKQKSWSQGDLQRGIPDNPIIDEAIRLYEEEVDLALT